MVSYSISRPGWDNILSFNLYKHHNDWITKEVAVAKGIIGNAGWGGCTMHHGMWPKLMPEGGFGPGTVKIKVLLDKHKYTDCVGLETSALEGDCITTIWEYPLNSDSGTWRYVWKSNPYVTASTGGTLDRLLATVCLGQTVTRSIIVC
jgi:hypothetical protein